MAINVEEARKIAHLARLDLTDAELTILAPQLSAILHYVEQLQGVETDGVEPLAHPLPVHNVFRPDDPTPSLTVEEALANAPARAGDFFGVPAVFE